MMKAKLTEDESRRRFIANLPDDTELRFIRVQPDGTWVICGAEHSIDWLKELMDKTNDKQTR